MIVLEAIKKIEKHAEEISTQDIRVVKEHIVGKCIRQGDVYIHMVDDTFEVGKELSIRQVADGVSMGQRHILKGHCKVYECNKIPEYVHRDFSGFVSYAFDVLDNGCVLTHPEHADDEFHAKGRCVVTYQMDKMTRQRVQD